MTVPVPTAATTHNATHQLAVELAAGLSPVADILQRFSLTPAQLRALTNDPHFRQLYAEAKSIWHGDSNLRERIKIKAQAMVEDCLLPVYGIVQNPDNAPQARLDGFSKLADVADVKPRKDAAGGGERFVLQINIPGEKEIIIEPVGDDDGRADEDPSDTG